MKKVLFPLLAVVLAIGLSLPMATPVAASPEPGIVGLWHLDEGTGSIASDSSGNNNDGAITNATWASGKFGSALSFDGDGDYVQLPASKTIVNTTTFTVEAWFKTSLNHPVYGGTEGRIVNLHWKDTASTAVSLYVEQDKIGLLYHKGSMQHVWVKYNVAYYNNVWHHIAVTYNGTTYRLYYDGAEVAAQADLFGGFGTFPAYLGTYNSCERFFNGTIDEVRIWNVALDASQIALSYSGSANWLPPVTNEDFVLQDGTTLPLKFQIFDDSGLVTTMQPVFVEVIDGTTVHRYDLGDGVTSLRWNAEEYYYIANLKTKDDGWSGGDYVATVGGIVTGSIPFQLSPDKGVGRGNSGK